MSYQVGAQCYATKQQAATAAASEVEGSLIVRGGEAYQVSIAAIGSTGDSLSYLLKSPSGAELTITNAYTGAPCGLLDVADASLLAWSVAAAWLGVYAVMHIRRAFFT